MKRANDCHFARNNMVFTLNETYEVSSVCNTEDWKTVLARPNDYPNLQIGEKVIFLEDFDNYYGNYARVKLVSNNKIYYLKYSNLTSVKRTENENQNL